MVTWQREILKIKNQEQQMSSQNNSSKLSLNSSGKQVIDDFSGSDSNQFKCLSKFKHLDSSGHVINESSNQLTDKE